VIDVDTDQIAALSAPGVKLAAFIELVLDGPVYVRYCTAGTDLEWDSPTTAAAATWLGKGMVIGVEVAEDSLGLDTGVWRVVFSAVASEVVSLFATERVRGRRIRAWLGTYDEAGALVSTPFLRLEGRMNAFALEDDPKNARGVITAQSWLAALLRAPNTYWTDADQKKLYPTDDGLKFADITAARTAEWGPRR
jgi:hypothetical protein